MSQTKLEVAAGLLADALETDPKGRTAFRDILAVTFQEELDRRAGEDGSVTLSQEEIIDVAFEAAEDFTLTIENQNDEE